MLQVLTILTPIFALILAGFIGRRSHILGATAAAELNRLVVWLCLPALLIHTTATTELRQIWHGGFVMTFTLATLLLFVLCFAWRLWRGATMASASLDALGASYANTGYVGIPLCLFVLGDAGLEPALIATLIVVCGLFAIAVTLIEVSLHASQGLVGALIKVSQALLKNPLVVSPFIGILWNLSGLAMPQMAATFLQLAGDATVPCALISLGAFLAHKQPGSASGSLALVLMKLLLHPLLAAALAYWVFALPPRWAVAAVLLSALPTGTGPYMLAEFYRHEASLVSRTILLSTAGSLLTLSGYLFWLDGRV